MVSINFSLAIDKIWILLHDLQGKYPIYKLWGCYSAMVVTRDPDDIKVNIIAVDIFSALNYCNDNHRNKIKNYLNFYLRFFYRVKHLSTKK